MKVSEAVGKLRLLLPQARELVFSPWMKEFVRMGEKVSSGDPLC